MAREETIQIKIDKSLAESSIKDLKAKAKELQTAFGSIKIGDSTKALKEQATASKAAAQAAINEAKANKEAANAEKARYQAVKELENATKAHLQAQKEAQNLATAKIKTEKEAANAMAATARAEKAKVQALAAADKAANGATRSMQGYANAMMNTIKQIVGFAGATQSIRYALNEMKAMSDEMVTYRKVTGATAQEMEKIRAASYSTAKKYGQTPSDFLASASEMARAGYGANSIAMAELATKTQLVGDMTAEAASKFLLATDAGYKYQGNIESLTAVLDAANEVDNNFATSIEKISEGMTLVASLAGSVHVPVEQLIAALGTMTAATQRSGAEMARGLRSIMLNVLGDTTTEIEEGVTVTEENIQSLTDALDKYGDSSVAAARKAGKLINPMQAISSLAKAWKAGKLDESTLFGISKDIAGQRYYNAFSSLIQNYDMYEAMLEKIAGSAGSAQKEVDNMLDSWSTKAEQLTTAWTELVNSTISENFIKGLLDSGTAALEFAGNLENLALMAGGAYEAIKSLASGISNLRRGNAFGGFNAGMTALGLGISAIGAWKSYTEYQKKAAIASAQESVKTTKEILDNTTSITKVLGEYKEITKDGIIDTAELSEAKRIQEQIKKIIGEQADSYDILNGKIQDNIALITSESLAYLQSQLSEAKVQVANVASSLKTAVGDGTAISPSVSTGALSLGEDKRGRTIQEYIENELSKYSRKILINGKAQPILSIFSAYSTDEIAYFYDKLKGLQSLFAELYSSEELSSDKAYSSINSAISALTPAVTAYTEALQSQYGIEANLLLIQDDFLSKKFKSKEEIDAYVQSLAEEKDLTKDQTNALLDMANALADVEKAADGSAGTNGFNGVTDSVNTLSEAIKEATSAKEKFDDAMKVSKADAMNGYIEAFETLKKEIEAGRVNSTAFYASARMLMGDTAYNATGGSSEAVMAALNRRGESGSLLDAEKILNQTYYNGETGQAIEGYGIYQLLAQTKGFDQSRLTNAEGYATVPYLSKAELHELSESWGGLSENLITSWLNAFDQYDRKGEATDQIVQAEQAQKSAEKSAEEEAALGEEAQSASEALNTMTGSVDAATEALNKLAGEEGENGNPASGESTDGKQEIPESTEDFAETVAEALTESAETIERVFGQFPDDLEEKEIYYESQDASIIQENVSDAVSSGIREGFETGTKESSKKQLKDYSNSIEKMQAFKTELEATNFSLEESLENLGATWDELKEAFLDYQRFTVGEPTVTPEMDDREILDELNNFIEEWTGKHITVGLNADPDQAIKTANDTVKKINAKTANIKLGATFSGGIIGGLLGGLLDGLKLADGTKGHPGGPAIVNDGNGPELIVDKGRAFIAGGGKPALVNLTRGARVFTASETRSILTGNGAPAYAMGLVPLEAGGGKPASGTNALQQLWDSITGLFKPTVVTTTNPKEKAAEEQGKSGSTSSANTSGSEKQINEKAFSDLKAMVDYILDRMEEGLNEQIDILDKEIDALKLQRDAAKEQNELEEKQKAVAEAQKDLEEALGERTVRYLGDDGKWHWMADARNVEKAKEALADAQKELAEYQDEAAFNAQVDALEKQKEALQEEYGKYTKEWEAIQKGVNTPTGTIEELIAAVLSGGTPQEQTGASAVRDYLIGTLLQGGRFKGNYNEALDAIAKATAGTPIMPDGTTGALAALIATGGGLTGNVADALRAGSGSVTAGMTGAAGTGGTTINYNYFVNGMQIGSDAATGMSISELMSSLTVYAGQ